jgi:hypothetical protein
MALLRLRELCVTGDGELWPLHAAAQCMAEAGWSDSLAQALEEALDRPGANPQVGALWMRSHLSRDDWSVADRLPALQARGPIGTEATCAYLECLGEARRVRPLRLYLEQHGTELRGFTKTWASAGLALATIGDNPRTALWLADWRNRSDVEPWMLVPLVAALRVMRRDAEAANVSRHALTLEEDGRSGCHAVWLAVDHAAAGDWDEVERLLTRVDPDALDPYYRFLATLAAAASALHQAADRADAFAAARAQLQAAAPPFIEWSCPAFRRAHRRLVLSLAAEASGTGATLWAWSQIALAALRGLAQPG